MNWLEVLFIIKSKTLSKEIVHKSECCIRLLKTLKVVCNEMNGGSDIFLVNSYWYGTHVIVISLNFYREVVF